LRVLITGASGFVGTNLIRYILESHPNVQIIGTYNHNVSNEFKDRVVFEQYDLEDKKQIDYIICKYRPEYIFHLAGPAFIPDSYNKPKQTIHQIFNATLNLLEAIKEHSSKSKLLYVGSANEYGDVASDEMPIKETYLTRPHNPYSFSKYIASQLCYQYYVNYGIHTVMARPFNHIGYGQSDRFVCSSFAKQIVEIERGIKSPEIRVGNLDVYRDFLDVRDVVRAYWLLLEKAVPGETYNVCSGIGVSIDNILKLLISKTEYLEDICVISDEKLVRDNDANIIIGDSTKLRRSITWEPIHQLGETLESALKYWREKYDQSSK
jgi:GDP-4-dehydro-6-deoxy-D-mannose reductase